MRLNARYPKYVPVEAFSELDTKFSKADLMELVWDLLKVSPYFNEDELLNNPKSGILKLKSLRNTIRDETK